MPLRYGEIPNLNNSGSSIVITFETISKRGMGITHAKVTLANRKEEPVIQRRTSHWPGQLLTEIIRFGWCECGEWRTKDFILLHIHMP